MKPMRGEVAQAGAILTVAALVSGILGYAFQVLLGRLLDRESYALFGALNSLGMMLISPLGAVVIVLMRSVASAATRGGASRLRDLYGRSVAGLAVSGMVVAAIAWGSLPGLLSYLRAPDATSIWLFLGGTFMAAAMAINGAFLQGFKQFVWLGIVNTASVFMKIAVSGVLIVACGWGLNGALVAILVTGVLTFLLGMVVIGAAARVIPGDLEEASEQPRVTMRSLVSVAVATTALSMMTQLDMVIVNHYFEPVAASQYAAASILGKVVLYLPGGVITALLPIVAHNHARSRSSAQDFRHALLMTVGMCGAAALFYWAFGSRVVGMLYGPRYAEAGSLLGVYGIAMLPITIVMLVENFFLAKGSAFFAWVFLLICPLEILTIHLWHPSTMAVIGVIGGFNLLLLAFGGVIAWMRLKEYGPHGTASRAPWKIEDQR